MRGNLYAVNTVAEVVVKEFGLEKEEKEETVEFRHIVEASNLACACIVAVLEEDNRCSDAFSKVNSVSVKSGELLVNGSEVVVDGALDVFTPKKLELVTDD